MRNLIDKQRRKIVKFSSILAGIAALVPAQRAVSVMTPRQTPGPFYPVTLPLDQDNDLTSMGDTASVARGEIVNVVGRLTDSNGKPIAGVKVEIWQCDANGRYRHPRERRTQPLDPNFQGYGFFITTQSGEYRFRTIKPVPYPGRAPHIHFAVSRPDREIFTTQMYVAGAPENERDGLLNAISDQSARSSLLVAFDSAGIGEEPLGHFNITLPV